VVSRRRPFRSRHRNGYGLRPASLSGHTLTSDGMGLQVSTRRVGGVTIVDLQGRATLGSGGDLLSGCLRKLIDDGERNVLLNLAGLTQLDSSSLGTFSQSYVSLRRKGGSLKLLSPRGSVRLVLETLHLLDVIPSYNDEEQAVASFSKAASA